MGEYGTFYRLRQGDVMQRLTPGLRNCFADMFLHGHVIAGQANDQAVRPGKRGGFRCLEPEA